MTLLDGVVKARRFIPSNRRGADMARALIPLVVAMLLRLLRELLMICCCCYMPPCHGTKNYARLIIDHLFNAAIMIITTNAVYE